MSMTTTPLTVGVMTFFRYGSSQAEKHTRNAPTKETPSSAEIMACASSPSAFMDVPSAINHRDEREVDRLDGEHARPQRPKAVDLQPGADARGHHAMDTR